MTASVTFSSIQDFHGENYPGQPLPSRGNLPDPRYASPENGSGYSPPHQSGHPPNNLPHLQPGYDHQSPAYPPQQHRSYYDGRRHPQYSDYPLGPYYCWGAPPPIGYPRDYRDPTPGSYPQETGAPMAQAVPRQRTSIACRYCRRRKIRCSGYQNAPGGKCDNCATMNQECIFQPVSSSSATAFVPLSAVQGSVPPGTQLFGAYGQPLTANSVPGGHHYPLHQGGQPATGSLYYGQPGQSPTGPYAPYDGDTGENPSMAVGKRSGDGLGRDEQASRSAHEDGPRRLSPAELSSRNSPDGGNYLYPAGGPWSPGGQNSSSCASTPVRQPGVPAPQGQETYTSKMSLSNLVDGNDIDKVMIHYLSHRG